MVDAGAGIFAAAARGMSASGFPLREPLSRAVIATHPRSVLALDCAGITLLFVVVAAAAMQDVLLRLADPGGVFLTARGNEQGWPATHEHPHVFDARDWPWPSEKWPMLSWCFQRGSSTYERVMLYVQAALAVAVLLANGPARRTAFLAALHAVQVTLHGRSTPMLDGSDRMVRNFSFWAVVLSACQMGKGGAEAEAADVESGITATRPGAFAKAVPADVRPRAPRPLDRGWAAAGYHVAYAGMYVSLMTRRYLMVPAHMRQWFPEGKLRLVYFAMGNRWMARPLAHSLAETCFQSGTGAPCTTLTALAAVTEVSAGLLIVLLPAKGWLRTVPVALLVAMHVSIGVLINIPHFFWLSFAYALPFLPTKFWDAADRTTSTMRKALRRGARRTLARIGLSLDSRDSLMKRRSVRREAASTSRSPPGKDGRVGAPGGDDASVGGLATRAATILRSAFASAMAGAPGALAAAACLLTVAICAHDSLYRGGAKVANGYFDVEHAWRWPMEFAGAGMNYGVFTPIALAGSGWWEIIGHVSPSVTATNATETEVYAVDLLAALRSLGRRGVERAIQTARRRRDARRLGKRNPSLAPGAFWDTAMVNASFTGLGKESVEYFQSRPKPPSVAHTYRYPSFRWEQHLYRVAYQPTVAGTIMTPARRQAAIANFLCLLVPDGRLKSVRTMFFHREMRNPEWRRDTSAATLEAISRLKQGLRDDDGTLPGMFGSVGVWHDITTTCKHAASDSRLALQQV